MNNAMAHRNGWNQQAQILECAYTSFFYDIKLEPSGIIQMHWNCINSIKVKQFKILYKLLLAQELEQVFHLSRGWQLNNV